LLCRKFVIVLFSGAYTLYSLLFVADEECTSAQESFAVLDSATEDSGVSEAMVRPPVTDEEAVDSAVPTTLARDCRKLASVVINYTYDLK